MGQRFIEGARVTGIRRDGDAWVADTSAGTLAGRVLVNCAGAWADEICSALGEPVPLETFAPMMMVTMRMPRFLRPVVLGTGRPLSFKQTDEGTVLIGGGRLARFDRSRETTELDFHELAAAARTVRGLFPVMRDVLIQRGWAGIDARTSDAIPVIGPSSTAANVFHAFGFSGSGFALGPIVGRIMADLIATGTTVPPIAPFSITRFDGSHGKKSAA